MSDLTKRALEQSLKNLLLQKPLHKITISDIADDCGINRMTFYYHFKDIYDLVEWSCQEDAAKALAGKKTYETWQQGFEQIFEAVLANKPFIMNVYHSVSREQVETYLYKLTYDLLEGVVEEQAVGMSVQMCIRDRYARVRPSSGRHGQDSRLPSAPRGRCRRYRPISDRRPPAFWALQMLHSYRSNNT